MDFAFEYLLQLLEVSTVECDVVACKHEDSVFVDQEAASIEFILVKFGCEGINDGSIVASVD